MQHALKLIVTDDLPALSPRESRSAQVMLSATMMTGSAEVSVIIRNVSSTGAMITTPVSPSVGSFVTLRRNDICVIGQVVWHESGKVGLHFRGEVDTGALMVPIGRLGTVAAH